MARRGLLDVPRHESGHSRTGRALRFDQQPELRGTARTRGPDAPGQPANGRGGGHRRSSCGRSGIQLMEPFTRVTGILAPLDRVTVDTYQSIPKQFLKRIERTGFGPFLFYDWRRTSDGRLDPAFSLNQPRYSGASVLVAAKNFGCGSSREHAVWAVEDFGFRVVIAPSFAD